MSSKLGRSLIGLSSNETALRRARRRGPAWAARAVAAALLLSGCGGDAPEPAAEATIGVAPQPQARMVEEVRDIEIGRVVEGLVLVARGVTETTGWSAPELRPRGPDAAGVLEFDFVATPPRNPVEAAEPARRVRADRVLTLDDLARATGVRVYSERGSVEGLF